MDDVETGVGLLLRDQPGGYLLTAQAASGTKAARAWLRLLRGTCEPATSILARTGEEPGSVQEGESQAAETARDRVPTRGAGTGRPVVARKPGNAGGAKLQPVTSYTQSARVRPGELPNLPVQPVTISDQPRRDRPR